MAWVVAPAQDCQRRTIDCVKRFLCSESEPHPVPSPSISVLSGGGLVGTLSQRQRGSMIAIRRPRVFGAVPVSAARSTATTPRTANPSASRRTTSASASRRAVSGPARSRAPAGNATTSKAHNPARPAISARSPLTFRERVGKVLVATRWCPRRRHHRRHHHLLPQVEGDPAAQVACYPWDRTAAARCFV